MPLPTYITLQQSPYGDIRAQHLMCSAAVQALRSASHTITTNLYGQEAGLIHAMYGVEISWSIKGYDCGSPCPCGCGAEDGDEVYITVCAAGQGG